MSAKRFKSKVDLHLASEHPCYATPRPAEKACIRPAVIEFPYCEKLTDNINDDERGLSDAAERPIRRLKRPRMNSTGSGRPGKGELQ